ncbi:hypothetical protein CW304_21100 [Bacillus sp. UFRGS-B20]|nr:hypothetical protein CW304_21100 [Bacillus sp. UFRGS-B20]
METSALTTKVPFLRERNPAPSLIKCSFPSFSNDRSYSLICTDARSDIDGACNVYFYTVTERSRRTHMEEYLLDCFSICTSGCLVF